MVRRGGFSQQRGGGGGLNCPCMMGSELRASISAEAIENKWTVVHFEAAGPVQVHARPVRRHEFCRATLVLPDITQQLGEQQETNKQKTDMPEPFWVLLSM